MSNLIACDFCNRPYSTYSLHLHRPKCNENPDKVINLQPEQPRNKRTRQMRRSRSYGHCNHQQDLKQRAPPIFNIPPSRPFTRTLSEVSRPSRTRRVCYVCGQDFELQVIDRHEVECYRNWHLMRSKLQRGFRATSPRRIVIPSVDGTVNVQRINRDAQESARLASVVSCRRCGKRIDFNDALAHKCTQKYGPEIQFYL